jgi:hypothetical protein
MDEDIVGSMLTSIMNFINVVLIKKSIESNEEVSNYRFTFGNRNLIVEKGRSFFIALILVGNEDMSLLSDVREVIVDIEEHYGTFLEDWTGELDPLKDVESIILGLLPLDELSEEERKAIRDNKAKKKVYRLWSEKYKSMIENGLLPKPQMWKNFNLNLLFEKKKENRNEDN